jgi:trans-2,3-dihydro-3-hydroxyanthranilate isomerase
MDAPAPTHLRSDPRPCPVHPNPQSGNGGPRRSLPRANRSTGLPALIVPLRDLDALRRCKVDWERYTEVAGPGKNLYVFCPESHDDGPGDLSARMFANDLGVPEDPATGSAAGCLAAYLLEHSYLGTDAVDVRVEQGYEIGRPSLLYLQADRDGEKIIVNVGGKVQMVARGEGCARKVL